MQTILSATQVFDGTRMRAHASVALTDDGRIGELYLAGSPLPSDAQVLDLGTGVLAPGLVDLQVNGGAGLMVGSQTDAHQLARICTAHARLGACAILPTLITDSPEVTRQVIAAGIDAARNQVAGFAGLHLEGPHLDVARKGAHDARFIRQMTSDDLSLLCDARQELPALMVTLAPEAVSSSQIAALAEAGVIVSLGHSACSAEQANAAFAAGARAVTHLFNAMGALHSRAPGLVGAALTSSCVAGIIADNVHVSQECLQVALQMKTPETLFLVTDAMAVAGTTLEEFALNGRRILRRQGRLTLDDGTLAGADISLPGAMAHLIGLGVSPERALSMASRIPADVIGAWGLGRLEAGASAHLVFLDHNWIPRHVWQGGVAVPL